MRAVHVPRPHLRHCPASDVGHWRGNPHLRPAAPAISRRCTHPPSPACHCEPVTDVTGVAIRIPRPRLSLRGAKPRGNPRPCPLRRCTDVCRRRDGGPVPYGIPRSVAPAISRPVPHSLTCTEKGGQIARATALIGRVPNAGRGTRPLRGWTDMYRTRDGRPVPYGIPRPVARCLLPFTRSPLPVARCLLPPQTKTASRRKRFSLEPRGPVGPCGLYAA